MTGQMFTFSFIETKKNPSHSFHNKTFFLAKDCSRTFFLSASLCPTPSAALPRFCDMAYISLALSLSHQKKPEQGCLQFRKLNRYSPFQPQRLLKTETQGERAGEQLRISSKLNGSPIPQCRCHSICWIPANHPSFKKL